MNLKFAALMLLPIGAASCGTLQAINPLDRPQPIAVVEMPPPPIIPPAECVADAPEVPPPALTADALPAIPALGAPNYWEQRARVAETVARTLLSQFDVQHEFAVDLRARTQRCVEWTRGVETPPDAPVS